MCHQYMLFTLFKVPMHSFHTNQEVHSFVMYIQCSYSGSLQFNAPPLKNSQNNETVLTWLPKIDVGFYDFKL